MAPIATIRRRGDCCNVEMALDPAEASDTAQLLKTLADPTRLSMLGTLRRAGGPVCICDFTSMYELTQPTISHHMARLKTAGLVTSHRDGIWVYYQLSPHLPAATRAILDAVLRS